jgi:hypothetical protein
MPCFFYSPHANASTKPKNVPFTEAELGANVLRMCPLQWQDQYNMNKKGMTPMDMHLLLTLLEAIKCICTYKKGKSESSEKSSHKSKKGKKCPTSETLLWIGLNWKHKPFKFRTKGLIGKLDFSSKHTILLKVILVFILHG